MVKTVRRNEFVRVPLSAFDYFETEQLAQAAVTTAWDTARVYFHLSAYRHTGISGVSLVRIFQVKIFFITKRISLI
jgi:hypothetical protein